MSGSDNSKDQAKADAQAAAKAKMLEALAKKQGKNNSGVKGGPASGSKVNAAAGANAPKMFRRKSGPSGSAG
ncbi:Protein of unknown function DUF5302 [actinobacterium SCGC AAA044-D11]|jgi:hypothetical protein